MILFFAFIIITTGIIILCSINQRPDTPEQLYGKIKQDNSKYREAEMFFLKCEMEQEYQKRLQKYKEHILDLKRQKAHFIKNNPDFPKERLQTMFMNVTAPPVKFEIKEI